MKNPIIDLSIIIVSFNTIDETRECLLSVQKNASSISHEVFVVDNDSKDGSADMVAEDFPGTHLIRHKVNKGFAGGNNPAMKKATGRYVLLLNSDAFLTKNAISSALTYMDKNPKIGVLGGKLNNPDGTAQPSARMLPSPVNKILHITGLASRFSGSRWFGRADFSWWDYSKPLSVGWVVGAFFLVRKETIKEIGLLDERYFLYFEEIDFCRRANEAGWDIICHPEIEVFHWGGKSSSTISNNLSEKGNQLIPIRLNSEFRYYRKWHGVFSVLISAFIEILWNSVVFAKNYFHNSSRSLKKRTSASNQIRIIIETLMMDRFGQGKTG
jgi:N-acetylglucosaminyl-diphospho-decaprenol L-rhamnosyltransferase